MAFVNQGLCVDDRRKVVPDPEQNSVDDLGPICIKLFGVILSG